MAVRFHLTNKRQVSLSDYSRKMAKKGSFSGILAQKEETKEQNVAASHSYMVRPGDTLYNIANKLKKTHNLPQSLTQIVKDLTALNRLSNPDLIVSGRTLCLPMPLRDGGNADKNSANRPSNTSFTVSKTDLSERNGPDEKSGIFFPLSNLQSFSNGEFPETREVLREKIPPASKKGPIHEVSSVTDAVTSGDFIAQMAMYREDQLLAHPGGDSYFLNHPNKVYDPAYDQGKFVNRVGKDLSDAGENLINIARDLTVGSKFKYVGNDGKIMENKREGLTGTVMNFFKDLISGLSFGAYVPANEAVPEGVGASIRHFVKKVFYEAPVEDLLVGVPHAGMNMVKDAALAAINMLEAVPDATLGNFDWGQKLTTTIFDNGQVAVDYLTDIIPGGNAWLRVHAAGASGKLAPPVLFNIRTPEQGIADSRWATVRNTPFRKTIETVGSLLCDAFTVMSVTDQLHSPSADDKHPLTN